MTLRYGFELEGFYIQPDDTVGIPPKEYPTDGFPGLVELRTTGAKTLEEAFAELVVERLKVPRTSFSCHEAIFTPAQKGILRRRHEHKSAWDIRNIYGKNPRSLGKWTIASFQINISNRLSASYTDDKGVFHPERFGLFDVARVVQSLDEAFSRDIKAAGRQPGEYCIKDDTRLEYRSLPNWVFTFDVDKARDLLDKIKLTVEE